MQPTVKSTTQFLEKLLHTISAAVFFRVWASFLGYECIEMTFSSKIQTKFSMLYCQILSNNMQKQKMMAP